MIPGQKSRTSKPLRRHWLSVALAAGLLEGCATSVPSQPAPAANDTGAALARPEATRSEPQREPLLARPRPAELAVEKLATLPGEVRETSGLAVHGEGIWTLNDGGNGPWLYQLDLRGGILRRVLLADAVNLDWESMAADAEYLYVADCGNNSGRRSEFQLYRVNWSALERSRDRAAVGSERQLFSYADVEPVARLQNHDNDCEAITRVGSELWLLTKGWASQTSRLYRLALDRVEQVVSAEHSFPVRGLVTAMDYSEARGELAILGYTRGTLFVQSFLWLVPVHDQAIDWSRAQRYSLSPTGQWEGLAWQGDTLLLTREQSLLGDAWLGRVRPPAPLHN